MLADHDARGARWRDDRAAGAEHDCEVDRDRQSGGRRVRGARDARHGWLVSGGERRRASSPAIRLLAETTGIFTETAGGATLAGALALAEQGRFGKDDEVVLCITGNGLKTLDAISGSIEDSPIIAPKVREVAALVEAAGV